MVTDTNYNGFKKAGEVHSLPAEIEKRWVTNGIAEYVEEEKEGEQTPDYSKMKVKELYVLCRSRGLDVEPKQPAEFYVSKLQELDALNVEEDYEGEE
jgi:hypothetical protein